MPREMQSTRMLKLLVCLCVAWSSCSAASGAVIPDASMYRRAGLARYPWNQISDTYGYVDRRPAPTAERDTGDVVFGVAHRYLGDSGVMRAPPMYPTSDDDYYFGDVDWSDAEMQRLWMAAKRASDAYDWSDEEETNVEPNAQDVINFENYIQRYVLPQLSSTDELYDAEDGNDAEDISRNDDEADKQLHSLLNIPQHHVKPQHYKKSVTIPTTSTTSTTTMAPTSTPVADVWPSQLHHQVGQKEEALLRPPAVVYQPTLSTPSTPAAKSIYGSIQRIINMRHQITVNIVFIFFFLFFKFLYPFRSITKIEARYFGKLIVVSERRTVTLIPVGVNGLSRRKIR